MENNNNLLIHIDNGNNKPSNDKINKRWSWVYADGRFEADYGFDIVLFNKFMPTEEGYYIAYTIESKAVIIHLVANENGNLQGRCCYIDDYESLKMVNSPNTWG